MSESRSASFGGVRRDGVTDSIIEFGIRLCQLGLDRGNFVLCVPKDTFLTLVYESEERGATTDPRGLRYPFRPWSSRLAIGVAQDALAMYSRPKDYVTLTDELVSGGIRIYMPSGPWLIRLNDADRAEMLEMFKERK